MSTSAWLLALVVTGLACASGGVVYGHAEGAADTKASQDAQSVVDLTKVIDSHKGLIKEAAQASTAMRRAVAQRQNADAKTTQEFAHALSLSAADRAGCLFDADSMRRLSEARDRAADAASGGLRGAVPRAAASTGNP